MDNELRPHRSAALLSVGDEIALGQTLDTNSAWLADRLFALGVRVVEHATVDDDEGRIARALARLGAEADLVIVTGGLGPTADDLTRQALARVLGEDLVEDGEALEAIRAWFSGRATGMPEGNRVQALRPASGACLTNPNGTAPGLFVRTGANGARTAGAAVRTNATNSVPEPGCDFACLPGPPHEMKPMFETEIVPRLRRGGGAFGARALLSFGLGESTVAERLGSLMDRDRESRGLPVVGTTASKMVVSVRLRHVGEDAEAVRTALDAVEEEVKSALGVSIFERRDFTGGDAADVSDALPRCVLSLLRERGERVAMVESCTGGLLGEILTSVPGSSDVFAGGWVTYSNEAKAGLVGVDPGLIAEHGAVSREVAIAMALGGLERAHSLGGAEHCLAITGVAGPGASDAKPAGTVWIARASVNGLSPEVEARLFRFKGGRGAVREWAARTAMGILRLKLVGGEMGLLGEREGEG